MRSPKRFGPRRCRRARVLVNSIEFTDRAVASRTLQTVLAAFAQMAGVRRLRIALQRNRRVIREPRMLARGCSRGLDAGLRQSGLHSVSVRPPPFTSTGTRTRNPVERVTMGAPPRARRDPTTTA